MPSDPEDLWKHPSAVAWAKHVNDDMVPKLKKSSVSISMVPNGQGDVKFWVELGASICMDKPIIIVQMPGTRIPEKLRGVADEIVVLPEGVNPAGAQELAAAIERVMERLGNK